MSSVLHYQYVLGVGLYVDVYIRLNVARIAGERKASAPATMLHLPMAMAHQASMEQNAKPQFLAETV